MNTAVLTHAECEKMSCLQTGAQKGRCGKRSYGAPAVRWPLDPRAALRGLAPRRRCRGAVLDLEVRPSSQDDAGVEHCCCAVERVGRDGPQGLAARALVRGLLRCEAL